MRRFADGGTLATGRSHRRAGRAKVSATPPLQRIHSDQTLSSGSNRYSLAYWRTRPTDEILRSLSPGLPEALRVKPDGRVMNGNTRVKVLEERGVNVDSLPREAVP